ncbi:MAG: prepilin peptidase [Alphaproteobacteria bacterium]|nr:prepilin peptidase [Alphaproteobacteria bacterium]
MGIFQISFLLACLIGACWDFLFFKIPNEIIIFIICLFLIKIALFELPLVDYKPFFCFVGALLVGYGLYFFRIVGAGDVKLIAAVSLWTSQINYFSFLFMMAVAGGVLSALFYFFSPQLTAVRVLLLGKLENTKLFGPISSEVNERLYEKEASSKIVVPYGIAIFLGSLATMMIEL